MESQRPIAEQRAANVRRELDGRQEAMDAMAEELEIRRRDVEAVTAKVAADREASERALAEANHMRNLADEKARRLGELDGKLRGVVDKLKQRDVTVAAREEAVAEREATAAAKEAELEERYGDRFDATQHVRSSSPAPSSVALVPSAWGTNTTQHGGVPPLRSPLIVMDDSPLDLLPSARALSGARGAAVGGWPQHPSVAAGGSFSSIAVSSSHQHPHSPMLTGGGMASYDGSPRFSEMDREAKQREIFRNESEVRSMLRGADVRRRAAAERVRGPMGQTSSTLSAAMRRAEEVMPYDDLL